MTTELEPPAPLPIHSRADHSRRFPDDEGLSRIVSDKSTRLIIFSTAHRNRLTARLRMGCAVQGVRVLGSLAWHAICRPREWTIGPALLICAFAWHKISNVAPGGQDWLKR